ncbi:MAG TPA: glycoside hydrolase family 18 protein, partial [Polyangiaceae bacterium]|nr:glycoside hydrolase family 18 protein [Polyangiaceae bacterium]
SSTTAKPVDSAAGSIGSGGTTAAPVSGAEEATPLGLGGVTPTSASSRQPPPAHWVTGYYVGYQSSKHPPSEIDFSGLSHLVMGAALVKADGSVDLSFYVGDANAGGTLARDVAKRAHAAGKRALLMVGGAGNGAAIASAVKNRLDVFVSNLVKAVTDLGYDGLDLDWEDSVDMPQFVSLAKALRAKMPNAILTVPGFTVNPNYQTVDPATKQLVDYLDQYNLMSYFPATAMAGGGWLSWHNSPLCGQKATTPVTIEDSLKRFTDAGVPKSKLGMGVAFYAICYTSGVTAPNQSTEGVSIMGGDNDFPVSELLGGTTAYPSSARHWDAQAQVPYLALSSADRRGCKYVSYDDEESLAAKGTFAKQGGYGGIIVWTISQGYMPNRAAGQRNPLMQALKKSFLD